MAFPDDILKAFGSAEKAIQRASWYGNSWSCCSGLWKTDRYGDTIVLRITKTNWSSVFPITVYEGGEIQYAVWIDEKLHRNSTARFEMHIFSFLNGNKRKIKKGDFTDPFRRENRSAIKEFGFHDTRGGPSVPYAGAYIYRDPRDLIDFVVKDFTNFASLSGSIDRRLSDLAH